MHDFGAGSWTSREMNGALVSSSLPSGNQTWLAGKSQEFKLFETFHFFGGIFQHD
jgi:hypothetical protein